MFNSSKVQVVQCLTLPVNQTEMKHALGLTGYLKVHSSRFAQHSCVPMNPPNSPR
jgi:hypothetical protein